MAYPLARRVVVSPTVEPVSLAEAKVFLRITTDAEDDVIASLIRAARQRVEQLTERALITQTIETDVVGQFPSCLMLPRPPLQFVEWIKPIEDDGSLGEAIDESSYLVRSYAHPGVVVVIDDSAFAAGMRWRIRYDAGYGDDASDVPDTFRHAIRLLAGHYDRNREAVLTGTSAVLLPEGVEALLMPERITEPV